MSSTMLAVAMNTPVISIIVPVYNVARYLNECVGSILKQSFADFELLLVDDGSTDDSGAICDRWAAKDGRIRVFHKANGGVSSARNIGLQQVQGKYVMFMDADDYWYRADCLATLLNVAREKDADIVRGEYRAVGEKGETLFEREITTQKNKLAGEVVTPAIFVRDIVSGESFLFLSLMKAERVKSLSFNTGQAFQEDADWLARLLLQPLACVYVPFRFYAYRKRQTSASYKPSMGMLADSFMMCDRYEQYARQASDMQLRQYFERHSVMMYYWTLHTMAAFYYGNSHAIVKDLGLKQLQRRTRGRVFCFKIFNGYFPVFMLPPMAGVSLLRMKIMIGWWIYLATHSIRKNRE